MAGLPFTVSLFLDGAVLCRASEGPAVLGLIVQRQDGNACGALGVAVWSGTHAAKFARLPFILIFLT